MVPAPTGEALQPEAGGDDTAIDSFTMMVAELRVARRTVRARGEISLKELSDAVDVPARTVYGFAQDKIKSGEWTGRKVFDPTSHRYIWVFKKNGKH